MLAGEACRLLDPLLVLDVRRKGRLGGKPGADHRLVDLIDLVATVKPDVAQKAPEAVALRDIRFQVQRTPSRQKPFEKRGSLGAVALRRVVRIVGLRRIDEDETHRLYLATHIDANRVTVGNADQG